MTQWQPIETAPKRRVVLVHYKDRFGSRIVRAQYYPPETLESEDTESGWADEGWYEESEAYEYLMRLEGGPTHWMPLPKPPGATSLQPDDTALLRQALEILLEDRNALYECHSVPGQIGISVDNDAIPALLRYDDLICAIKNRLGDSA